MSSIDERVVELQFNNKQFETGVQQSVGTLQKLKNALTFGNATKGLTDLQNVGRGFSLQNVADNVQRVADRFTFLGNLVEQVRTRINNSIISIGHNILTAVPNQIISGGKRRAQNIEQAQFQLKGLLKDDFDWKKISEDLDYAVSGTAYGLDAAAKAAAQLKASNIDFGDDMKTALRGISGVAAMTNSEYEDIAHIFTTIAGQGKMMSEQLNQFAGRGLNVAATLAEKFKVSEAQLRDMVSKGKVDFKTFAAAMNEAFGEQATKANDTFTGALSNVKASLSRMGAQFATPAYDNLRKTFVALIPVLKDIEKLIKPISASFTELAEKAQLLAVGALTDLHMSLLKILGLDGGVDFDGRVEQFMGSIEKIGSGFPRVAGRIYVGTAKSVGKVNEALKTAKKSYEEIEEQAKQYIKDGKDEAYVNKFKEEAIAKVRAELERYIDISHLNNLFDGEWLALQQEANAEREESLKNTIALKDEVFKLFGITLGGESDAIANSFKEALFPLDEALTKIESIREAKWSEPKIGNKKIATIDQMTSLADATKIAEEAYAEVDKVAEEWIKSGKDEATVNKYRTESYKKISSALEGLNKKASLQVDINSKQTKGEKVTQEIRKKALEVAKSLKEKTAELLGLEKEETKTLGENGKAYAGIEELAQDVIFGKYGNGEERKKKLEELGVSYAVIQNKVNELMGVEKRHEVTAEEEARTMAFFGQSVDGTSTSAKKAETTFDKLTNTLAGIGAALSIVKNFGQALITHIVGPFVSWALPKVLGLILSGLSAIGKVLVDLNQNLIDSDFFNVKFKAIADWFIKLKDGVVDFWEKAKELDGVKALADAFGKLSTALGELWNKIVGKVTSAFSEFSASLGLSEEDTQGLLNIVDDLAGVLAGFVDFLASHVDDIASFFKPFADWLLSIGPRLQGFWEAIGGFEGIHQLFKPLIDWLTNMGIAFQIFWSNITQNLGLQGFLDKIKTEGSAGVIKAFGTLFKNIGTSFAVLGEALKGKFKDLIIAIFGEEKGTEIINNISEKFHNFKDAVQDILDRTKPLESLKEILKTLFGEDVRKKIDALGDSFIKLLDSFIDGDPIEALKGVWESIKTLFSGLFEGNWFEKLPKIGDIIKTFFTNLFRWDKKELPELDVENFVPDSKAIQDGLQKVGNSLKSSIKEAIFGDKIYAAEGANVGNEIVNSIATGTANAASKSGFNPLGFVIDAISSFIPVLMEKLKTVGGWISTAFTAIIGAFKPGNIVKVLATGGIIFVITRIIKLISIIKGFGLKSLLYDVSNALKAFTAEEKTKSLLNFAKAIGIMTAALIALTFVDINKFYAIVGALTVAFVAVGLVIALIKKVSGSKNEVKQTFTVFEGLGKAFKKAATLTGIGLMFAGIAAALYLIAKSLDIFSNIDWDNAMNGVAALVTILVTLALIIPIMALITKKSNMAMSLGVAFAGIGAAIYLIAISLREVMGLVKDGEDFGEVCTMLILLSVALMGIIAVAKGEGASHLPKIAVGMLLFSGALIVFGKALQTFKGIKLEDIGVGLLVFIGAMVGLAVLGSTLEENAKGILQVALALAIISPILYLLGKNAAVIGPGLIAMGIALGAILLAALLASKVSEGLEALAKSLLAIGAGMAVVGIALPMIGVGLVTLGQIAQTSLKDLAWGFVTALPLILLFTVVAKVAGGAAIMLGAGIALLAAGVIALMLVFSGRLNEFIDGFGQGISGVTDAVKGAVGVFGGAIGVFAQFGKTLSDVFGKGGNKGYTMAIDSYQAVLKNMDFVTDEVYTELSTKIDELGYLDGSDYSIGIANVVGYINNLNLNKAEKTRLIQETLTAAEKKQIERFTYTVHNIKVLLDENGVSVEDQEHIFEQLEALAQLKKGSITFIVEQAHAEIQNMNLAPKDEIELKNAFDEVVASDIKFRATVRDLKAYINNETSLDAEGAEYVQTAVDGLVERKNFYANLDSIYTLIGDAKMDPLQRKLFEGKIMNALKQQKRYTTALGTVKATISGAIMDPEQKAQITTYINDALAEIDTLIKEGDETNAKATLEDIKLYIDGIDSAVISPEAKKDIYKKLNEAFNALKAAKGELTTLFVSVDEILPQPQAKAFKELWDTLINTDSYNEAEVEKLWVKCNELGMSDAEIKGLLDEVGVVLDAGFDRAIQLNHLRLTMSEKGIKVEDQENLENHILAMMGLDDDENAEEYEIHRKAAVDLMVASGMTEDEANALVEEYVGEAGDAKTAKLSLLSVLLDNATFATDAERASYQQRLTEMMSLYGTDLTNAITNFKNDIIEKSSLSQGEKDLITERVSEVANIATSAYSAAYEEVLQWQEKLRRQDFLGSFIVMGSGETVNSGSVVAKEMANFFKDFEGELTDSDIQKFAQSLVDKGYSPEDIISSFSNTGMTDEELFNLLFPLGEVGGLQPAMFREFIRPYVQNLVQGATDEYKNEVSRYGKIDWEEILVPETDEEGKATGLFLSATEGYTDPQQSRVIADLLDTEVEQLEQQIRDHREELGQALEEGQPITFDMIYDYFFGENAQESIEDTSVRKVFPELVAVLSQLHETASQAEDEDAYLQAVFKRLNRTLYKTGDGLGDAAEEAANEAAESYKALTDDQKEMIKGLKSLFDPLDTFKNDVDFYAYVEKIFGSGFGIAGLEGLNFEEIFKDGNLDIMGQFLDWLTTAIENEQVDASTLAKLYKQFPSLRDIVKEYYQSEEGSDKTLPEGFQETLNAEVDKYKEEFDAALAKATSEKKTESTEGKAALHDLISSGLVTQEQAATWFEDSDVDFGSIIGDAAGVDIENMDTSSISTALAQVFGAEDFGLGTIGEKIGAFLPGGLGLGIANNASAPVKEAESMGSLVYNSTKNVLGVKSPSTLFKTIGLNLDLGLRNGIKEYSDKPVNAMAKVAEGCINILRSKLSLFFVKGSEASLSYGTGISSRSFYLKLAGMSMMNYAIEGAKSLLSKAEDLGKDFVDGYVKGLTNSEKLSEVKNAGQTIAKTGLKGTAGPGGQDSKSPSKKTRKLGNYFSMGYVVGIKEFGKQVGAAGEEVANTAVETLRSPLGAIQGVLNSDLDYDPTIRPVMDLSQIQNGVRTINGMMPDTKVGLDFISASMSRVKTTNEDVVSAIAGLSKQMENLPAGNTYTVNGVTYDDGSNISNAVRSLVHAARVERRR